MDYVYDIVLNFQNKYYDFYEWLSKDRVINIAKIIIYKISNESYLDIKNNDVLIDKNSLPKQNKMFLLTSGSEVMGIFLNNRGKVIKKSGLLFDEADDILKKKLNMKKIALKYTIIKKQAVVYKSRIKEEKLDIIKKYFKNIDKEKDEYILKYLYYDIYNTNESDLEKIYKKLTSIIETNTDRLYSLIDELGIKKIH